MNKKCISLLSSGLLILSLTGCNASVKLFGKEVFTVDENKQEQVQEKSYPQHGEGNKYQQKEFDENEVLSWLLDGDYTLNVNGDTFVYNTEEMLIALFDNQQEYQISKYGESSYLIQVINKNQDMFITFMVEDLNQQGASYDIVIVEVFYDGYLYEENASNVMAQVVYEEIFNPEDGTLTKKQQVTKEEKKSSKEEQKQSKEEPKKEEPKQEKKQETPKTCKWCYTNQLPSGAGENDKCKECQQECWNFICTYCNKNMSLEEYHSYGEDTGMCPSCYDKYLQETTQVEDDHKHYYCDRCGVDVTFKNFLQNIEGFDYLCEGCLLELGY
jgi:hypothetical protein